MITGPYHHFDEEFPGVCFLGKPLIQKVPVQSEPFTIAPPGLGVSLKIPPGAIRPNADKPVTVTLQACLSGLTFKYPEGCTPLSAVYHISADAPFEKEVALTLEHYGDLETEQQASEMSFFKAKSVPIVTDGREVFVFSPVEGGRFAVGGSHCTLSTQSFSFVGVGAKRSSAIRKFMRQN